MMTAPMYWILPEGSSSLNCIYLTKHTTNFTVFDTAQHSSLRRLSTSLEKNFNMCNLSIQKSSGNSSPAYPQFVPQKSQLLKCHTFLLDLCVCVCVCGRGGGGNYLCKSIAIKDTSCVMEIMLARNSNKQNVQTTLN
jgi:hypothetical protein